MGDTRHASRVAAPEAPTTGGPFAGATARLVGWLEGVVAVQVVLGPPVDDADEPASLRVWPLDLVREQEFGGGAGREPFRFRARYLLTVAGTDDIAAVLDPALVAAVTGRDVTVVVEQLDPALWQAMGVRPRAALVVEVPAQVDRSTAGAPRVRTPLRLSDVTLGQILGRVVGPGDIPLADVEVEDLGTGKAVRTRADGTFTLAGVPAGARTTLRLAVKGRQLLAEVEAAQVGQDSAVPDPTVIHCDLEEV